MKMLLSNFALAAFLGCSILGCGKSTPSESGKTEPVQKETLTVTIPETEIAATAATDNPVGMAKNQLISSNNLKQLALGVLNYSDTNKSIVPSDLIDRTGKKLLSWRVQLLPYIEQVELYKEFKLDEPWNSEHNMKLMEKMPKTLASPRVSVKKPGFTVYQVFAGPGTGFPPGNRVGYPSSITDGTSQTIMIAESSVAVPWTKPADMPFDINKELPDFGVAYGAKPLVVMFDGSVHVVDMKKVSAATLKAAITISGGETLGADWK